MSFQPVIPFGGHAGWAFLGRTKEAQQTAFEAAPLQQRETEYFAAKIGEITTAEELVSDRTLLKVALGAFGLDDDISNKFFIQKVLEDGTLTNDALANRLADKRYQEFSSAFGFGDFDIPRTQLSEFPGEIIASFNTRQFEIAVGEQNESMRLALSAERDIADIAASTNSNDGKWFTIMGTPPLRSVFETALNLPSSFGTLDIDKQLEVFKERASNVLGTDQISDFTNEDTMAELVRVFLARTEIQGLTSQAASGSTALTLLQSAGNISSFFNQ